MGDLSVSLACCRTSRTEAIFARHIRPLGIDLACLDLWSHEIFQRMAHFQEFDVSEMSLSSYLIARDQGTPRLMAIPVFLQRAFRLKGIYIRTDAGIATPADLRGRRMGVPEYQLTTAVWVRGILQDVYGVAPQEIRWVQAGLEEAGRMDRLPIRLPPSIDFTQAPDRCLNEMMAAGDIDAIISSRPPLHQGRPLPNVRRLFPAYKEEEQRFFKATGIFPIIHTVAMREELYQRHPWIAVELFRMFDASRELWLRELRAKGPQKAGVPWVDEAIEEVLSLMGESFWTYGLDPVNTQVVETLSRYSAQQGLIRRPFAAAELFAPSTGESIHY